MKAIFVSGSPRKGWNTDKLMKEAMRGAAEAGADVEAVYLYDIQYTGCRSCFACKAFSDPKDGLCKFPDALKPVMEKIKDADILVIASPIYLDSLTGQMVAFMERLQFPVISYKQGEGFHGIKRHLAKEKKLGLILDMGANEITPGGLYEQIFDDVSSRLALLLGDGTIETLYSVDAWQFTDYSKYDVDIFDIARKEKHRDEQLPKDLEAAYAMGKKLAEACK